MKKFKKIISIGALIISLFTLTMTMGASPLMERKIIVYKLGTPIETQTKILNQYGSSKIHDLNLIHAQSAMVPHGKLKDLVQNPNVLRIEDDVEVNTLARPSNTQPPIPQSIPWGIEKIDAELSWSLNPDGGTDGTTGDPVKVAVIDTGIDVNHPDLQTNIKGGVSTVSYTKSYTDDNGHGTHVAGTIGAIDNSTGVVGVAPNVDLYAVKVLNRKGSGYTSDIIKGLKWCIDNHIQVVNMSFGTTQNNISMAEMVILAHDANIVLVAASGNDSGAVIYPAALPGVIAVGATDANDKIATFSSRGDNLDLVAPGVNILSTYQGSYSTLSGTSMASPHVAGAAALVIDSGKANTPVTVEAVLKLSAIDLGLAGWDDVYGNGLVNVYNALQ